VRKHLRTIFLLLAIHVVLLAVFAAVRLTDHDEGLYAIATRMVHLGMQPYSDFFYMQMSMMPSLFAPFGAGGWESFYLLRGFAVLAGLLSAIILTITVHKMTGDSKATLAALFLYVFSGLFIAWHSTFKTLPFTHFFSLATFFFWLRYYENRKVTDLILTGLLLSALINFRSVFIVLLPLYIISILALSQGIRVRNVLIFLVSLMPFTGPTLIRIYDSSANFFYGNLMFHLYKDVDRSFVSIIGSKLEVLAKAVIDPQLLILMILAVFSIGYLLRSGMKLPGDLVKTPKGMALMNFALIFGVYVLPHPMTRQYIEQYLGFAIIIIVLALPVLLRRLEERIRPVYGKSLVTAVAAVYVLGLIPYFVIFIFGVRAHDNRYRISEIKKVTSEMLALGGEADTVLSEWPGYLFFTRQTPLRYTELVAHEYNLPLEHKEFLKHKLCDRTYLREKLGEKSPSLVVNVYDTPEYYADILELNYEKAYQSDVVSIYKRR